MQMKSARGILASGSADKRKNSSLITRSCSFYICLFNLSSLVLADVQSPRVDQVIVFRTTFSCFKISRKDSSPKVLTEVFTLFLTGLTWSQAHPWSKWYGHDRGRIMNINIYWVLSVCQAWFQVLFPCDRNNFFGSISLRKKMRHRKTMSPS